jgi:hypothetical protein
MTPEQITDDIQRAASVRLVEAGYFLKDQIQEMIGVQAPYHITASGEYVADEPATPGAPPRRLSGDLVESGFVRQVSDSQVQVVFSRPYAGCGRERYSHRPDHRRCSICSVVGLLPGLIAR